jgi:hypothetical protein
MKQAGKRQNVTDRHLADEKFDKRTADRTQKEDRVIPADSWQKRQSVTDRQLAEDKTLLVIWLRRKAVTDRQLANNRMYSAVSC